MINATSMHYDYFCTVGSGLEHFCSKELQSLGLTNVSEVSEGKVFFSSSLPVLKLLSMRTPERLFLLVHKEPQFLISHPKRKAILMLKDVIESHFCSKLDNFLKKWRDFPCSHKCSNVDKLSFRVSCKSYGAVKRVFPPAFLGKIIAGSLLNIRQTWSTDLRNPQLEVLVHAKSDTLIVGIACCPVNFPLSKRPYLPSTSSTFLRPTVCSALIDCGLSTYKKLSQAEKGLENLNNPLFNRQHLVILDPMCGSGMILAEAVSMLNDKNITLLGSDIDKLQVETASRNILNASNHSKQKRASVGLRSCNQCISSLFVADARALPLKNNSVDVIISDVPFGLKHHSYSWKKESSYSGSTENTSKANECYQLEPVHCCQVKGNVIPLHVDGNEIQDIVPKQFIKLDSAAENIAKEAVPILESMTQTKDPSEGVSHPLKRRKLEDKEIQQTMGVNRTKSMLPNLVKELDRVLKRGGQSVLLISENLKADLLSAVNEVKKSDIFPKSPDHSSEISKSKINGKASVIIGEKRREKISTSYYNKSNSKVSTKSEYEWILIKQHPVKLGILDAVICVFSKQCMNE